MYYDYTDYYQRRTVESWFTNLKRKPLNRSHDSYLHRTNDLLTESIKTKCKRTTGPHDNLINNKQLLLTVTLDGSKRPNDITSLHS